MPDVFGRADINYGGSFAADSAVVVMSSVTCDIPGLGLGTTGSAIGVGLLAQNLRYTYQQPIQRFFELGNTSTYFFAGRPSGQGSIGRLLGPRAIATTFYNTFGNVCCIGSNALGVVGGAYCTYNNQQINQASPQGASLQVWPLVGVCLTSVGGMVAAEDMILREELGFIFFRLGTPQNVIQQGASGGNAFAAAQVSLINQISDTLDVKIPVS